MRAPSLTNSEPHNLHPMEYNSPPSTALPALFVAAANSSSSGFENEAAAAVAAPMVEYGTLSSMWSTSVVAVHCDGVSTIWLESPSGVRVPQSIASSLTPW